MADSTPNPNTPKPPAVPPSASNPGANPTANAADKLPASGGEPIKQATTATTATKPGMPTSSPSTPSTPAASGAPAARPAKPVLPPAPANYEMPDDYETDLVGQTRTWVEANPVLAVVAAAGAGLLVGRIVMALLPDPAPKTFTQRVEKRALELRKEGARYADDAGDAVSEQLKRAAAALGDAAEVVAGKAEAGVERSKDLAEVVGDAVKAAVTGVVAKKTDSWIDRLRG